MFDHLQGRHSPTSTGAPAHHKPKQVGR
jgi:hypothetical protein